MDLLVAWEKKGLISLAIRLSLQHVYFTYIDFTSGSKYICACMHTIQHKHDHVHNTGIIPFPILRIN